MKKRIKIAIDSTTALSHIGCDKRSSRVIDLPTIRSRHLLPTQTPLRGHSRILSHQLALSYIPLSVFEERASVKAELRSTVDILFKEG